MICSPPSSLSPPHLSFHVIISFLTLFPCSTHITHTIKTFDSFLILHPDDGGCCGDETPRIEGEGWWGNQPKRINLREGRQLHLMVSPLLAPHFPPSPSPSLLGSLNSVTHTLTRNDFLLVSLKRRKDMKLFERRREQNQIAASTWCEVHVCFFFFSWRWKQWTRNKCEGEGGGEGEGSVSSVTITCNFSDSLRRQEDWRKNVKQGRKRSSSWGSEIENHWSERQLKQWK